MKLGTIKNGTRDGQLVVVKRDNSQYTPATGIAPTMQAALDAWDDVAPQLEALAQKLESGEVAANAVEIDKFHSPLPRAYEWIDGSAYINHIVLVRKARDAEPPATLETDPLVYQGGSGVFLAPTDGIPLPDPAWGLDFEAEVAVVLGDTPQGVKAADAGKYVKLLMILNDNTFRNLIPAELAKNFGFFQSKPATAFAPFAITPDELGEHWQDGRVDLPLKTDYNGEFFGDPDAGPAMHFSFFQLIEHIAKTRAFTAGTILGSGTVSNEDRSRGSSCLSEKRMIEKIDCGEFRTPYMQVGDTVDIRMRNKEGLNLFGTISQKVIKG